MESDPIILALARLDVREYFAAEMREYLEKRGVSAGEASRTVSKLVEEGKISDHRYASVITRAHALRGKGPLYILAKLRHKGLKIELSAVQQLFRESVPESEELGRLRSILERRYPKAALNPRERRRAFSGLLRRGFSKDLIAKCLKCEESN